MWTVESHELVEYAEGSVHVSQDEVKQTGETGVEETILEGHIGVTKELLAFQTPEKKYHIGCEKGGANLIKVTGRRSPRSCVEGTRRSSSDEDLPTPHRVHAGIVPKCVSFF